MLRSGKLPGKTIDAFLILDIPDGWFWTDPQRLFLCGVHGLTGIVRKTKTGLTDREILRTAVQGHHEFGHDISLFGDGRTRWHFGLVTLPPPRRGTTAFGVVAGRTRRHLVIRLKYIGIYLRVPVGHLCIPGLRFAVLECDSWDRLASPRIGVGDALVSFPAVAHVDSRSAAVVDIGFGKLVVLGIVVHRLGRQLI